jgi:hypothetical protein
MLGTKLHVTNTRFVVQHAWLHGRAQEGRNDGSHCADASYRSSACERKLSNASLDHVKRGSLQVKKKRRRSTETKALVVARP